jgi:hypothetical protein
MRVDVPFVNIKTGKAINLKHHITGYIDLMAKGKKDTKMFCEDDLMVLDYKTASREWDQFTVDTNIQLLMYAYAIRYILRNENFFPETRKDREDRVGIISLHKKNMTKKRGDPPKYGKINNYIIMISDGEIDFLQKLLLRCIDELEYSGENVHNYLPNPTPMNCKYCEYKEPCLMTRRGAGNLDINAWGEINNYRFDKKEDTEQEHED